MTLARLRSSSNGEEMQLERYKARKDGGNRGKAISWLLVISRL